MNGAAGVVDWRGSQRWDRHRGIEAGIAMLLAAFVGVLAAYLPSGAAVRFSAVVALAATMLFAWAFRAETNAHPRRFLPGLLWCAVLLSVIWPRYVLFSVGGPYVSPFTVSVLAALAAVLSSLLFSPPLGRQVKAVLARAGALGWLVAAWVMWRFVASALGEQPVDSTVGLLRETIYLASFFLFGCVIVTYESGGRLLLRTLLIGALFVAAAGLIEGIRHTNPFVGFASGAASPEVAEALAAVTMEKIRGGGYRSQSTFDHPIVFAQFVAAMVPLALYFALHERSTLWKLLGRIVMPLAVAAIALSGSRSGWVGLAAAATTMAAVLWLRAMRYGQYSRVLALLVVPAMVALSVLGYYALHELALGQGRHEISSTEARIAMLRQGVAALSDSPIWGFGHGMAVAKAGLINPVLGLATIDNYFLSVALDAGYVGLLLFLAIVVVYACKGLGAALANPGIEGVRAGACVAGVLAVFVTFAGLSIPNNLSLMWLLMTATLPSFTRGAAARAGRQA